MVKRLVSGRSGKFRRSLWLALKLVAGTRYELWSAREELFSNWKLDWELRPTSAAFDG